MPQKDFCNKIGTFRTSPDVRLESVNAHQSGRPPTTLNLWFTPWGTGGGTLAEYHSRARQHGMCQRTRQIGPDSRLVAQILRLVVAAVEPRKGPEQPRVALRGYEA